MTFDTILFEPTQVWLELSESDRTQAWQQSQSFSTTSSCWNAYLNQLCLDAILPWLREEYTPTTKVWPHRAALPSFWELLNGTTITLDAIKLILVPTETIDAAQLRVAQEWVDIPSLTADYYLAVQVNPDEGWVQIWGYTTHLQLKQNGLYDECDRTYSLTSDNLILDLNVLSVARQLCPAETTRAPISPLNNLPQQQAQNLLQRLANPALISPRLALPFHLWAGLIQHGGWRQNLSEMRLGLPQKQSMLDWLHQGVSDFAQQFGWSRIEFQPDFCGARGVKSADSEFILCRQLTIAGQQYELRVLLVSFNQRIWRFQLQNSTPGGLIPGGFKLRLLTEDLQAFENNEDVAATAVDLLYIEVAVDLGEGLVWETEPLPENYEHEILRF